MADDESTCSVFSRCVQVILHGITIRIWPKHGDNNIFKSTRILSFNKDQLFRSGMCFHKVKLSFIGLLWLGSVHVFADHLFFQRWGRSGGDHTTQLFNWGSCYPPLIPVFGPFWTPPPYPRNWIFFFPSYPRNRICQTPLHPWNFNCHPDLPPPNFSNGIALNFIDIGGNRGKWRPEVPWNVIHCDLQGITCNLLSTSHRAPIKPLE